MARLRARSVSTRNSRCRSSRRGTNRPDATASKSTTFPRKGYSRRRYRACALKNSIVDLASTQTGTSYILGNSVGLESLDLASLASDRSCLTIGVNRLLRVFAPEYLLVADLKIIAEERDRLRAAKPKLLVWRKLGAMLAERKTLPGVRRWTWDVGRAFTPKLRQPCLGYEPSWTTGVFLRSGNTGTYAIEAAALMGCTEIRLLGIDLRFDLPRSHFFGTNKHKGRRITYSPRQIKRMVSAYRAIHDRLKTMGVRLINESPIDGPLDEWIPREKSKWLKK